MAQRWVLYGDGLLVPASGFGETLLDTLLLAYPQSGWQASLQGAEDMTLATALHEASWRVIGKAPQGVALCFGAGQIEAGESAETLLQTLRELLHLIRAKTHADLHLFTLPLAFFPEGEQREEARAFNQGLLVGAQDVDGLQRGAGPALKSAPKSAAYTVGDANADVDAFLALHREGVGEKHALHQRATRPTHLGRLVLAQSLGKSWPWPLR